MTSGAFFVDSGPACVRWWHKRT